MHVHELKDDASATLRKVGMVAETQATLNIALTGVCLAALLVAMLLVRSQRNGAS